MFLKIKVDFNEEWFFNIIIVVHGIKDRKKKGTGVLLSPETPYFTSLPVLYLYKASSLIVLHVYSLSSIVKKKHVL